MRMRLLQERRAATHLRVVQVATETNPADMLTTALGTAKFEGCCEEIRQAEPYAGFFCACLPTLQTSSQVAWPHVHELLVLLGSIPACGHDVEVQNFVNHVSAAARLTCWATLFAFSLSLSPSTRLDPKLCPGSILPLAGASSLTTGTHASVPIVSTSAPCTALAWMKATLTVGAEPYAEMMDLKLKDVRTSEEVQIAVDRFLYAFNGGNVSLIRQISSLLRVLRVLWSLLLGVPERKRSIAMLLTGC